MKFYITTDQTQVVLNPLRGPKDTVPLLVQLHLELGPKETHPSSVQSLHVSLLRFETLEFIHRVEQNTFPSIRATLNVSGQTLTPGTTHTWQTILNIPHTSPASFTGVGNGNKCRSFLHAGLNYQNRLHFPRIQTAQKEIILISQPALAAVDAAVDADPFIYTHTQTGAHDGLGPVLVQAQAHHLTIGGSVRVHVQLPAPSESLKLESIEFGIQQKVTLRSRRKDFRYDLPSERHKIHSEKLSRLRSDGWLLRLPSCSALRPSSVCERLGIHIVHTFYVRISYTNLDAACSSSTPGKPASYTLGWHVILPSCALQPESVLLPPYSQTDRSPVPEADRTEIASQSGRRLCVCGKKQQDLLAIEALMAQIHGIPEGVDPFNSDTLATDDLGVRLGKTVEQKRRVTEDQPELEPQSRSFAVARRSSAWSTFSQASSSSSASSSSTAPSLSFSSASSSAGSSSSSTSTLGHPSSSTSLLDSSIPDALTTSAVIRSGLKTSSALAEVESTLPLPTALLPSRSQVC
ncbi:hypothetical protein V8E36_001746 [Tilletia maclaganii]